MQILVVIQPDDELVGAFHGTAVPNIGESVALQRDNHGWESGYRVIARRWQFDHSFGTQLTTVQIDIEKRED